MEELTPEQEEAWTAALTHRYGSPRVAERRTCGAIPCGPKELGGGVSGMRHPKVTSQVSDLIVR
jgi:hypothetical protein